MKKWKGILAPALLCCALLACLSACGERQVVEDTINIAHIGPKTGSMAGWGLAEYNTLKLLVDEANASGGIAGRQVNLLTYDNRGDNVETQNVAREAIQEGDAIAIIGTNTSATAIALSEVCGELGVPQISTTSTNAKVTRADDGSIRPYTFRICLSDPQLGEVMAQYAYQTLGIATCATLYETGSDYSTGVTGDFVAAFEACGGTVTAQEAYKTGDVDFRAQLIKINASGCEAIFMPLLYKELGISANQARSLGLTQVFIGPDCWQVADLFTVVTDAVEGSYFVAPANLDDPLLAEFRALYEETYGEDPASVGQNAFFAYDAYLILKNAIEKADRITPAGIKNAIENETISLEGLTGSITMLPSHNPIRDAYIFTVENGEFVFVEKFSLN